MITSYVQRYPSWHLGARFPTCLCGVHPTRHVCRIHNAIRHFLSTVPVLGVMTNDGGRNYDGQRLTITLLCRRWWLCGVSVMFLCLSPRPGYDMTTSDFCFRSFGTSLHIRVEERLSATRWVKMSKGIWKFFAGWRLRSEQQYAICSQV